MLLLGLLIVTLAIRLLLNPKTVGEFDRHEPATKDQLADRLDPNLATAAELAAIPELGEKRAAAIFAFRERFNSRRPGQPAFTRLSDLEQIPGIGAATAENMAPYLTFPAK